MAVSFSGGGSSSRNTRISAGMAKRDADRARFDSNQTARRIARDAKAGKRGFGTGRTS